MTIHEDSVPASAPAGAGLQVIEGGRIAIERAALDAVFTAPDKLPDLLKRLSRPAGVQLGLVPSDAGASRAPASPDQSL